MLYNFLHFHSWMVYLRHRLQTMHDLLWWWHDYNIIIIEKNALAHWRVDLTFYKNLTRHYTFFIFSLVSPNLRSYSLSLLHYFKRHKATFYQTQYHDACKTHHTTTSWCIDLWTLTFFFPSTSLKYFFFIELQLYSNRTYLRIIDSHLNTNLNHTTIRKFREYFIHIFWTQTFKLFIWQLSSIYINGRGKDPSH